MTSYPREISLHNGRIQGPLEMRNETPIQGASVRRTLTAREIQIQRCKGDASYSDIPRRYTGVDIRTQETDKVYLILPNGGHLRSAFSEVEGLDRYANKGSQGDSSREIDRPKTNQVSSETPQEGTPQPVPIKPVPTRIPNSGDKETIFEQLTSEFEKRSPYKSEARAGKRIGFYRFILDIGRGNFSKVKLATHSLLNAEVAVKVIDRSKFDAKTRRLLSQELANMERLNHPNIIQLFEVHEFPQRWHLIMEYASAGELHSYLKRNGRLDDRLARTISSQIVSALEHMHNNGVVHRDLKAENVLFMNSTLIKVGDFGFSKHVSPNDALTTFCGSPPYAAPELFVADSYVGPAVDLWALGVLIYYMVVGHLPFRGDSIAKIKRIILEGRIDIPIFVPNACKDLIRGLLTQPIEERYTIVDTQRSVWFTGVDWKERTRETDPLPDQLDDQAVRGLLNRWWKVNDWELERALRDGPKNSLTGVYRILRAQGRKYLDAKMPTSMRKSKSNKKSRDRKKDIQSVRPVQSKSLVREDNSPPKSKRVSMRRTEEVTTVDLRDKTTLKGKMDKGGETTSRTCNLL